MENIKHCYIAIGLLYLSSQENKTAKFVVQVCRSKKSFAVAEKQKNTANVPQTCEFAVADHLLLFCGICGCKIEFKFAVPSTVEKPFSCSARGKRSIVVDEKFFSAASAKELLSIFLAGTADRNPSIRFAAASFFGSDWLNKQPKNSSLLTDSISLSLSPLSLLAPLMHNSTC